MNEQKNYDYHWVYCGTDGFVMQIFTTPPPRYAQGVEMVMRPEPPTQKERDVLQRHP